MSDPVHSARAAHPFLFRFGQAIRRQMTVAEYEYDSVRQIRTVRVDGTWRDVLDAGTRDDPPGTLITLLDAETTDNQ